MCDTCPEMFLALIHLQTLPEYVENTCGGVFILVKFQVSGLHLNQK